ncbi:unnamed protein product [Moneuplotes crassus]|uniref:Uncharacterized protein n=1 Tax=Euplotes crassus TaxID=5936 RepID=A0AAD1XVF2_EUPCR|nr:unnamed protein product [Moneuplotes crassus]
MIAIAFVLFLSLAMAAVRDQVDYAKIISPIAHCQVLENGEDIYGSVSILQDSLYTSVVNVKLNHIDPGHYVLMFHQNEIEDSNCGSGDDISLFGEDQTELGIQVVVPSPENESQTSSHVNIISESNLIFLYGEDRVIDKSMILHRINEEGERENSGIACCTVRFI